MRKLTGVLYRNIVKPILFLFPADRVHEFFLTTGRQLGRSTNAKKLVTKMWRYDDQSLRQTVAGLDFKNPIGLSAGFDYDADLVEILPSVGFGFHTIGTLTIEAYKGNQAPMLGRLPKSRSLLVNKGFKNKGISSVLSQLQPNTSSARRGVSIGATNKSYLNFNEMLDNLVAGFKAAEQYPDFDYYELNISCPNLLNLQNLKVQLSSAIGLGKALDRLASLNLMRPVFIKMPLEKTPDEMKELINVAKPFPFIKGLIFSNLAKDRSNPAFDSREIKRAGPGNFSGKPVEQRSNDLIRWAYKLCRKRFVLIGVGGVFTAQDAYTKIKYGASLVQLITGMIYMGPQQIGYINKELAELLKKDGYKSIQEAIGTSA